MAKRAERRRRPRVEVRIVTEIDATESGESAIAVLREISLSGGRFLTNTKFDKGTRVHLGILLDPDDPANVATIDGEVVRLERVEESRSGMWRWELGVQFTEEATDIAADIEALAEVLESDED